MQSKLYKLKNYALPDCDASNDYDFAQTIISKQRPVHSSKGKPESAKNGVIASYLSALHSRKRQDRIRLILSANPMY